MKRKFLILGLLFLILIQFSGCVDIGSSGGGGESSNSNSGENTSGSELAFKTKGNPNGVALYGDIAFVADYSTTLTIVNVSNTNNPYIIGSYGDFSNSGSFDVVISNDGTKAYVTTILEGLKIIDISNPSNPSLIGTYSGTNFRGIKLSKDGSKAFIASGDGLNIIDVSNPSSPSLISQYKHKDMISPWDIILSPDELRVFITDSGSNEIFIIDISNIYNPNFLSSYLTNGGSPKGITTSRDGNRLFVANGDEGLLIIDVSNPLNPSLIGQYISTISIEDIVLSFDEKTAFVTGSAFQKLDITDITNPTLIKDYGNVSGEKLAVSSDEKTAFITNFFNAVLYIVNIQ